MLHCSVLVLADEILEDQWNVVHDKTIYNCVTQFSLALMSVYKIHHEIIKLVIAYLHRGLWLLQVGQ